MAYAILKPSLITTLSGEAAFDPQNEEGSLFDRKGALDATPRTLNYNPRVPYDSMRIIGMAEPIALTDIFTNVFLLDKPSAWRRFNIEELKRQSLFLKHLVLQCTTGKLNAVPIFVGLKAWADSGLALMPFLTHQFAICAFPDAQPFIEHIF